jgi:hypothetical protein
MYYPSSQIQTNLYSNGELSIKSTKQIYTGFYWKTSRGEYFMGKSPDSPNSNVELLNPRKSDKPRDPDNHEPVDGGGNMVQISYSSFDVINYLNLNKDIDVDNLPQIPIYTPSLPTKEDYESQEFTRFFCKKKNESFFIEINQNTFTKLKEEDSTIDYESYIPFKLSWTLTGEQNKVALENKNAVDYTENKLGALGLSQYIKYDYLLHYNITPGVTKKNSKRVYSDTGIEVPLNLPKGYRLIKDNKACVGCIYLQQGICNKWSAPVRENYYCHAFKAKKSLTPQQIIETLSSSGNIYNQNNSY